MRVKLPWITPEIHLIKLDGAPADMDLASLPDEELEKMAASPVFYQASEGFVTREIAGEVLAIPVGMQTQSLNGMVTFSEAGAFLWKLLEKRRTREDLIVHLAKEYDQRMEQVSQDVDEFLERALKRGLVVECK